MDLWDFPHTTVAKQTSAELFRILPMTDVPTSYQMPPPTSHIGEFKRRNTVTALQRRPSLSSKEIEQTITHIATNPSDECKKSWYIIQQLLEEVKSREQYNKELEVRNQQLVQKSATGQERRHSVVSSKKFKNHRSTSITEFVASPRARKFSCLDINAHVVVPMDLVQEMLTCESDEKVQRKTRKEPCHYEQAVQVEEEEEEEDSEEDEESNSQFGESCTDLREQLNNYVFPLSADCGGDETPEQSYYSSCEISTRDYDDAEAEEQEFDELPESAQEEDEDEEVEQCEDEEEFNQSAQYRSFADSLNIDEFEPYISDDEES